MKIESEKQRLSPRRPLIIDGIENNDWYTTFKGMIEDKVVSVPFPIEVVNTFEKADKLLRKKGKDYTDLIAAPWYTGRDPTDSGYEKTIEFGTQHGLPVTIITGSPDLVVILTKRNIRAILKDTDTIIGQGISFSMLVTDPRLR